MGNEKLQGEGRIGTAGCCTVVAIVLLGCVSLSGCSTEKLRGYFDAAGQKVTRLFARPTDTSRVTPAVRPMVARTAVRVRTAPGTDAPIIGVLARGETIAVETEENGWYRVRYKSERGWVCARYVRDVRPVAGSGARAAAGKRGTAATANPAAKAAETSTARAAIASEQPIAATSDAVTMAGSSAASAAASMSLSPPSVEIAGIPLRWGMSKDEAATFYRAHGLRVDSSGAVWLRAAAGPGGDSVPLEWFKPRFCNKGLCGVHHVLNATHDEVGNLGDRAAAHLAQRYGPPADDRWDESKFGRMRLRDWRTPGADIRLSHQEDQLYATIDYERTDGETTAERAEHGGADTVEPTCHENYP